ncbi:DUF3870 domain-containing protein [Oscillibacter sp. MSJ-2]|uniref:DUF3870 domain-containing protein n=1 Tax=Dysosmobacter acutus TaxID=2841504 RepID=A0ABS6F877_9FIRM|nr:DUF3870 domain-containing protein [Dysosmobacter acutus]MBU5626494.1 DUF3870 domain-containing protein [Dysosmobacter acutus]
MEHRETVYVTGESRTNIDNAITKVYGAFFVALEVDLSSGEILNMDCTHTLDLTETFLRRICVGRSLDREYEQLEAEITRRYYGSSTRAVIAALKDANKRYIMAKEKLN